MVAMGCGEQRGGERWLETSETHAGIRDEQQWCRQRARGDAGEGVEGDVRWGYTPRMIGVFTWSWASTASGLAQTSINTRSLGRSAGMTEEIV